MSRVVTLYGRPDCHLCDEAAGMLRKFRRQFDFAVEVVDIGSDAALEARYCFEIPVVTVEGREIARAPIRAGLLEDALAEALGATRGSAGGG